MKRKPLKPKILELLNELYQTGHEIRWHISANECQFRWSVSRFMRQDVDTEKTWYDVEGRTLEQCVRALDQAEREFEERRREQAESPARTRWPTACQSPSDEQSRAR